jgi:hypothetical protein
VLLLLSADRSGGSGGVKAGGSRLRCRRAGCSATQLRVGQPRSFAELLAQVRA